MGKDNLVYQINRILYSAIFTNVFHFINISFTASSDLGPDLLSQHLAFSVR